MKYFYIVIPSVLITMLLSKTFRQRLSFLLRIIFNKNIKILRFSFKMLFIFNGSRTSDLICYSNKKIYIFKFIGYPIKISRFMFSSIDRIFAIEYFHMRENSYEEIPFNFNFAQQQQKMNLITFNKEVDEVVMCIGFIPKNLGVVCKNKDDLRLDGDNAYGINIFITSKGFMKFIKDNDLYKPNKKEIKEIKKEIKKNKI